MVTPATTPIDDTGLVCLYKFDESTTSVPNSSTGSDTGGTDFDSTVVGGTPSEPGHISGADSFLFDGSDDYLKMYETADNFSLWNWLHNGSNFSITYWLKRTDYTIAGRLFDSQYDGGGTLANGVTGSLFANGNGNWMVTNNASGRPLDVTFSTAFWGSNDWHFYVHTMNWAPATGNWVSTVDNATTITSNKTAAATSTNNSLANMTGFRTAGSGGELGGNIQQWTFWNTVIDSDIQDALWNDGAGRAFY